MFEGPAGWGEFSPFPGFTGLRERCMEAALESALNSWPAVVRSEIPVYTTVPEISPFEARELIRGAGASAAEVAVGTDERADLERLEAVTDAIGTGSFLSVDVKGPWDVERAIGRIRTLSKLDVTIVKDPVATLEEMAELRRKTDVVLAADKLFQSVEGGLAIKRLEAADVVVAKVQSLGGIRRAAEAIEASGLPAIVESPIETSVGIANGVALAATLEELPYPCGLATSSLLAGDLTSRPLVAVDGFVEVRRVVPDEDLLTLYGIGE